MATTASGMPAMMLAAVHTSTMSTRLVAPSAKVATSATTRRVMREDAKRVERRESLLPLKYRKSVLLGDQGRHGRNRGERGDLLVVRHEEPEDCDLQQRERYNLKSDRASQGSGYERLPPLGISRDVVGNRQGNPQRAELAQHRRDKHDDRQLASTFDAECSGQQNPRLRPRVSWPNRAAASESATPRSGPPFGRPLRRGVVDRIGRPLPRRKTSAEKGHASDCRAPTARYPHRARSIATQRSQETLGKSRSLREEETILAFRERTVARRLT